MDKATLSKKSVLALERLAKKVGAKTVTPDGKKKNKTQLINSVIIAERLGKKNPARKTKKAPARKTLAEKPKAAKAKARVLVIDSGRMTAEEVKKLVNHKGPVNWRKTSHNMKAINAEVSSILKDLRAQYKQNLKPVK